MREIFVTKLVKEILGPRGGIREILSESPLNEYITGVLAPITDKRISEIDDEAELPFEESQSYEEETADVSVDGPPLFSPALDPKNRSPTMGMSFLVQSSEIPQIRVCLTWARYRMIQEGENTLWQREPRLAVFPVNLNSDNQILWIDSQGRQVNPDQSEISFHVIVGSREDNRYFVTFYLVNRIRISAGGYPTAEHHIFQPQIRVVCGEGTQVVSGVRKGRDGLEEQTIEFLYRDRPVLARGHLCSAMWKDIDPENAPSAGIMLDFPECHNEPVFAWIDGELLSVNDRAHFSPPDVRTEFVPMYSMPAPELYWRREYGNEPELSAERLAEIWDAGRLRSALSPLADGYERWINDMQTLINSLPQQHRSIAQNIIQECITVLERIRSGIDILCNDDDAKLAFCFANKAIDLQSRWSPKKTGLIWYPFQLAFVLMTVESLANPRSTYRNVCDLLWVPTGAGKTEAYLGIAAFIMAYRRRKARRINTSVHGGGGVSVLTRYTLRILTIQQFRRALRLITACEYLRVYGLKADRRMGWRPRDCSLRDDPLWGWVRFSAGLWVGGEVTPNRLSQRWTGRSYLPGAIEILQGQNGSGEPAQVTNCPVCGAILAIPEKGLRKANEIHLVVRLTSGNNVTLQNSLQSIPSFSSTVKVIQTALTAHSIRDYYTISLHVATTGELTSQAVDDLWRSISDYLMSHGVTVELQPARAARPGYFIVYYSMRGGRRKPANFEIYCPNPACELNRDVLWTEGELSAHKHIQAFQYTSGDFRSTRIPIPAMTVDEQVYHYIPSMLVATVDKFARMPFEPRCAAIFGNVEFYGSRCGYYRQHAKPHIGGVQTRHDVRIQPFDPPDLIIQDELHLIEGPLGSLAGIYEAGVDFLCSERNEFRTKYIASTATVKKAREQVQAVFMRGLQLFPPHGLTAADKFFIKESEIHPLSDRPAGRLYLAVCAPGRGPLTPIVRIWSKLLQTVWEQRNHPAIDTFWTLTGYFNAVRELAGARALYRQDIPQRVNNISAGNPRTLSDERGLELSSRTTSTELPAILDILSTSYPDAPDALFTTSMFGTGVDIPRIGLMVVNGQPKTTSAYIQSTGRVGRTRGALVVTFFRASRPRDLSHYEFFCGYHRQLHRFVEPVTVYPFAPGVLERAAGPVGVSILRNMRTAAIQWHRKDSATEMAIQRTRASEVRNLPAIMDNRAGAQPVTRQPAVGTVSQHMGHELDTWQSFARTFSNLLYIEYAISAMPQNPVVLGDPQHQHARLPVVYENVPQSLRDIEETTGFE